ncbi:hypothetical protein ACIRU3_27715 [Streptomyces sp. NPDC101151]|uniref:hypothetical protein n=1 Tax=Streptomyces sp. NPDC101151 TaxID=3366115 RepID=UPI00382D1428
MTITRIRRIILLVAATALAVGGVSQCSTAFADPRTAPASVSPDDTGHGAAGTAVRPAAPGPSSGDPEIRRPYL